jgi:hypothetical protein
MYCPIFLRHRFSIWEMFLREIGKVGRELRYTSPVTDSRLGYSTPQNLQHYAAYLDSRIRAYRDLKHDVIRVQSESNRDWRNSNSIEDDANRARGGSTAGQTRSKTVGGKKLRVISVEKGLLRETKIVQNMINALAECRVRHLGLDRSRQSRNKSSFLVLLGRPGRWSHNHYTENARQGSAHSFPGRKRRGGQRLG